MWTDVRSLVGSTQVAYVVFTDGTYAQGNTASPQGTVCVTDTVGLSRKEELSERPHWPSPVGAIHFARDDQACGAYLQGNLQEISLPIPTESVWLRRGTRSARTATSASVDRG